MRWSSLPRRPSYFLQPTAARRTPTTETLFGLAKEIADFADEQTEHLNFEDYAALMEYEAKLLAFGNVLSASNQQTFLEEEIGEAMDCLEHLRQRISLGKSS